MPESLDGMNTKIREEYCVIAVADEKKIKEV